MKQATKYRSKPETGKFRSPYKWYFWLALILTLVLTALFVVLKLPVYLAYIAGVVVVELGRNPRR